MKKVYQLISIMLLVSSIFLLTLSPFSGASESGILSISICPTSVLADNTVYNCIFIQLSDSSGHPLRAIQDTTITLTSSIINIGSVEPSVTILKGMTYASAKFYSTLTSGSTAITASSSGYSTVQAIITTVTPIPSTIAVFGFPSTLPADGNTYPALMVQLQDSNGVPQRAPLNGVTVTLSCSDTNIGSISPESILIPYNSTYAIASFTTTLIAGSASITTLSNGYNSKQMSIATKNVVTNPSNQKYLKIFTGPTNVLADNNNYPQIAIELQDNQGNIVSTSSNITINLVSTDITIGSINQTIIIGPQTTFQTYSLATFSTTYKSGITNIIVAATDWNPDTQSVSTIEFIPPKLAVFAGPSQLPADNGTYNAIIIQLQDSRGRPARNLENNTIVSLFSQHPEVTSVISTIIIPLGASQATVDLKVSNTSGTSAITAAASGYTTGQTQTTTYVIDFWLSQLQISQSATPQTINSLSSTKITSLVSANSNPVTGATFSFTSDIGGTFGATTDLGNGYYETTFTAPSLNQNANCSIIASVSKLGYLSNQVNSRITVNAISTSATPSPTPTSIPTLAPNNSNPISNITGAIKLCIKDANDNPLNETVVSSIIQPSGLGTLLEVTNSSGYVIFNNALPGSYIFRINKVGYTQTNASIEFSGSTLDLTITLPENKIENNQNDIVGIIVVSIIVVVLMVFVLLFYIRKNNVKKVNKILQLQKQLIDNPENTKS